MKKRGALIVFVILIISFISASFQVGDEPYSIDTEYGALDDLRGWINISFSDENTNSTFSDSFGNSISLIDLLEKNSGYEYECNTEDCGSDYSAINGVESKTFSLGIGNSRLMGIKFSGKITAINSINFKVQSNAGESCYNQLKVDVLDDKDFEFGNPNVGSGNCSFTRDYGCFDSGKSMTEYTIGKFPNKHCQKVNLSESPGFKIGAWVKQNGDTRDIIAIIYKLTGEEIGSCTLPKSDGEVSCNVDYLLTKPSEHYVCIFSDDNGNSSIRGYSSSPGCGFYGINIVSGNAAFQIFAEGKGFDSVGTFNVTNTPSGGDTLSGIVQDYILEKYGDLDCTDGCIVPIDFFSQKEQQITINNLEAKYETELGPTVETNFYELSEIPSKVDSDFQKLFLDNGGFEMPSENGNYTFSLRLNADEIISKKISVSAIPVIKYITPIKTAAAYPTTFEAKIESSEKIEKYEWDFGDDSAATTTTGKTEHTYSSIGNYSMKLTIFDSSNKSSYKVVNITVLSPKEIINSSLSDAEKNIENLNYQIEAYSEFYQKAIKNALDFETIEDKIDELQKKYVSANEEEEYNEILKEVLELKIPEDITVSKNANNFVFYPAEEDVDVEALSEITKEKYDSDDKSKNVQGIFSWYYENINTEVSFKEFSGKYENYEEPIVRIFDVSVMKKTTGTYDAYIVLRKVDGLDFKENYLEGEVSGYVYVEMKRAEQNLVFSTTEDIDFITLPLFVSPEMSRLPLVEFKEGKEDTKKKWILFIALIILLLVVAFAAYIFMQEWYKRKYEKYLFRNRNDLYNLVTYIQNAMRAKEDESKTISKLKKAGWNSEQISYAMNKYGRKRTGMLEIPVDWILNLFRRKNQDNFRAGVGFNR